MNPLPFTETSPSRGTKIDVELKAADEVEESKTQMYTGELSLWKLLYCVCRRNARLLSDSPYLNQINIRRGRMYF